MEFSQNFSVQRCTPSMEIAHAGRSQRTPIAHAITQDAPRQWQLIAILACNPQHFPVMVRLDLPKAVGNERDSRGRRKVTREYMCKSDETFFIIAGNRLSTTLQYSQRSGKRCHLSIRWKIPLTQNKKASAFHEAFLLASPTGFEPVLQDRKS